MVHLDVANNTKDNSSCGFLSYRMLSKLLVLLQAILLMSGCAAFMGFPPRVTDRSADLEALQKHIDAAAITECLKATNEAEACRNKLITARTYGIDIQFSAFEEDLFRQAREAGFAATLTTLGLTAAGAVAGGGTTQVLSAIAAGITGSRAAFDREVLAERTVLAIHTSMRANRMIVLARIRQGLRQSVSEYPLAAGFHGRRGLLFPRYCIGGVDRYHQSRRRQGGGSGARPRHCHRTFTIRGGKGVTRLCQRPGNICGRKEATDKPDTAGYQRLRSSRT